MPGPGVFTDDGCPVAVYAALPPGEREADLVGRVAPPGASVLDLGTGTGRVAEPLARRGYDVVGVDDSPEMLAHLTDVTPVLAGIEDLSLGRLFDVVLLASHFVNVPDVQQREALVRTAARHVAPAGHVLFQWHPPEWFDGLVTGEEQHGRVDPFDVTLRVHAVGDGLLTATVAYARDGDVWTQDFQAAQVTRTELTELCARVGLPILSFLDDPEDWVVAAPG